MGHSESNSTDLMTRITDALDQATTAIDNATGRTFTSATATRTFRTTDSDTLYVPDLVSLTLLELDDDDDGTFETTVGAGDYELDTFHRSHVGWPYEMVRMVGSRSWPYGGRRQVCIRITGVWGWSAVPAPINKACSLLAARWAQRESSALFGAQSFGDLGIAFIRSTDPDAAMMLEPYTKAGFA
jgi:hypothetical protein